MSHFRHWTPVIVVFVSLTATDLRGDRVDEWLKAVRSVEAKGEHHEAAVAATKELRSLPVTDLPRLLEAMDGANPLAKNWLRGIAESILQRARESGQPLPKRELERFLAETHHDPRARRLAYEWIALVDPQGAARLVPGWLNDPSPELRRDAVALVLERAAALRNTMMEDEALRAYREAFQAARDLDQIKTAAEAIRQLGGTVDIATHMGFILHWHLVGPFDNTNKQGFDVPYPPEKGVDLTSVYQGKEGEVRWFETTSQDDYGLIDLNMVMGKYKGAIAYAFTTFLSAEERDVQLRLGCINGNKVWLNGELLISNHVYHAGSFVDQYIGKGRLKKGRNEILVKIAQNEQTEQWAQNWQFQLRVCDEIGTAVLSQDRPATQTANAAMPRRLLVRR